MQEPPNSAKPVSNPNALDLLASILGEFGTKPKKEQAKAKAKPAPVQQAPRSIARQIALLRTGYITWEPQARAIFIRTQVCSCCGTETQFVENEFYVLKHGKSQSRWFRTEGYLPGLETKELPLEIHRNPEPLPVSVCPQCIKEDALDHLVTFLTSPQLCLEFPDD